MCTQVDDLVQGSDAVYSHREVFFRLTKINGRWLPSGVSHCVLSQNSQARDANAYNACFSEWIWDGMKLVVRNDRFGFIPLYYYCTDTDFCISGSILTLIEQGAPLDLDFCALGVLLRLRYYLGNDTPFASIKLIPPAVNFLFEDGKLSVSGGVSIPKTLHMTRSDAIDAFIYTFRSAVRRTRPENEEFVVPLSGGRDSRHLLLELLSSGHRPKCCISVFNYDPWPSEDVAVARSLCAAAGIRIETVSQPKRSLSAELSKNIETSLTTVDHSWIVALEKHLQSRKHRRVYEGVAGDIYTRPAAATAARLELYRNRRFVELADGWLDGNEPLWRTLLGRDVYRLANREATVERMASELALFADAPNPFASFFFYNRTRRVAALSPFSMLGRVATVVTPFLDHEVHDLMCSLPGDMFLDKTFHTEAIARAYPEWNHIPYAATKKPTLTNYRFFAGAALEIAALSRHRAISGSLIRRTFLWPRLVRCLIDRSYSPAMGWLAEFATYLLQLESIVDRRMLSPSLDLDL